VSAGACLGCVSFSARNQIMTEMMVPADGQSGVYKWWAVEGKGSKLRAFCK